MQVLNFLKDNVVYTSVHHDARIIVVKAPHQLLVSREGVIHAGRLVTALHRITAKSFGVEEDSVEGMRDHVLNVDLLSILYTANEIIGFSSAKLYPNLKTFYLHGVAVSNSAKTKGAGKVLVQTPLSLSGMSRLAFTTQNPVMYMLGRSLCVEIYPNHERPLVPKNLQGMGKLLINGRRGRFDSAHFVIQGLYNSCLYDQIPTTRNDLVNRWFWHSLRINNGVTGDGFLFIGGVKLNS